LWELRWDRDKAERVNSIGDLERKLDRLSAEYGGDRAIIAHLISPKGETLSVGLGKELSVLNYAAPEGWPAMTSRGDRTGSETIIFGVSGEVTELPIQCAIPFDLARRAACDFFVSGKLPEYVQWEDD
jgi:hypothetical protein